MGTRLPDTYVEGVYGYVFLEFDSIFDKVVTSNWSVWRDMTRPNIFG